MSAEEKVSRGWVDFSFRISNVPRFFLETTALNSKLADLFFRSSTAIYRGGYLRFFSQYVEQFPVPCLNLADPADQIRRDRIVALVDEMLALQCQLASAEHAWAEEREDLARRIARVDREIDALVYELYGLTEEEIAIVEGKP